MFELYSSEETILSESPNRNLKEIDNFTVSDDSSSGDTFNKLNQLYSKVILSKLSTNKNNKETLATDENVFTQYNNVELLLGKTHKNSHSVLRQKFPFNPFKPRWFVAAPETLYCAPKKSSSDHLKVSDISPSTDIRLFPSQLIQRSFYGQQSALIKHCKPKTNDQSNIVHTTATILAVVDKPSLENSIKRKQVVENDLLNSRGKNTRPFFISSSPAKNFFNQQPKYSKDIYLWSFEEDSNSLTDISANTDRFYCNIKMDSLEKLIPEHSKLNQAQYNSGDLTSTVTKSDEHYEPSILQISHNEHTTDILNQRMHENDSLNLAKEKDVSSYSRRHNVAFMASSPAIATSQNTTLDDTGVHNSQIIASQRNMAHSMVNGSQPCIPILGSAGEQSFPIENLPKHYPPIIEATCLALKTFYTQKFGTIEHAPWLTFPCKPEWVSLVEPRIRMRRHNSILLAPVLETDDLYVYPGDRLLVTGPRGVGRSVWMSLLIHRLSLNCLPGFGSQFKIIIYVPSGELVSFLRNNDNINFDSFILGQLTCLLKQCNFEGFDSDQLLNAKVILDWVRNNSGHLLVCIDIDSDHSETLNSSFISQVLELKDFLNSGIILSVPLQSMSDIFLQLESTFKIFDLVSWSDDEILKYLRDFSSLFDEDDAKTEFLEFIESLDCCRLLQIASNSVLACLLYFLNTRLLGERPRLSSRTDLLELLLNHLVNEHISSLKKVEDNVEIDLQSIILGFTKFAWDLVGRGESDGYVLQIPIGDTQAVICSQEFEEFLAAKYISIRYFQALLNSQLGVMDDLFEVKQLFLKCWAFNDSYILGRVCVFLSKMLDSSFSDFLDALTTQFSSFNTKQRRQCINICSECIQDNYHNKPFLARMKSIIEKPPTVSGTANASISMQNINSIRSKRESQSSTLNNNHFTASGSTIMASVDYITSFTSISDGLDARNLSSLKLNETTLMTDDALPHLNNCLRKARKLRELEIDFTPLDPALTQRVAFLPSDIDYSPLQEVIASIKDMPSLRTFAISARVDIMSWEAVELVSGLFTVTQQSNKEGTDQKGIAQLENLSINLVINSSSVASTNLLYQSIDISPFMEENINYLIDQLILFLKSNSSLSSIELASSFLKQYYLEKLKPVLLNHKKITQFSIKNFSRRDRTANDVILIHPYVGSLLADLIRLSQWQTVIIDLTGCLVTTNSFNSKRSLSTSYLNGVVATQAQDPQSSIRKPNINRFIANCSTLPRMGSDVNASPTRSPNMDSGSELVHCQVLSAFHNHNSVEHVHLLLPSFHPSLLDSLTDFIERCSLLNSLHLSAGTFDDSCLLAIGCGVVCATRLQLLRITGSLAAVANGGSLPGLLQSCSMSPQLAHVIIDTQPLSIRALDSLCLSLPDIPLFPVVPRLQVDVQGKVVCKDVKSAQKKIEKLSKYQFGTNFELHLNLEVIKK